MLETINSGLGGFGLSTEIKEILLAETINITYF